MALLWALPIPPTTLTDGFNQEFSHQVSIKLAIVIANYTGFSLSSFRIGVEMQKLWEVM